MFSSVALLTVALTTCGVASANGRFPRAQRLLEDPRDASHLILGATFGMLVTNDAGGTWRHVCEASFGEAELQTDPVIALAPDGAILAGIYASVARSAPDVCDFQRTLGQNNREAVPDFTLAAGTPGRAVAVLVSLQENAPSENRLFGSDDAGKTWMALGAPLDDLIASIATVEVAPSNSERVYLSGLDSSGAGVLLRSDDGGRTFTARPVPTDAAQAEAPYIAAVDAEDADAIYLRTDEWVYDPSAQVAHANDALLFSADGGETFTELLRRPGKLFGFAFSPRDDAVLVGYGDPVEAGGGRLTDPSSLGIYRAAKASNDFEQRYAGSVGCLTWTARGIYACTLEAETGFTLGLAKEADFERPTPRVFTPLLRLKDVAGPVECPACSSSSVCKSYWQSSCRSWGRQDCESLIPKTPDACGGAGNSGRAGAVTAKPATSVTPRGGCSCRAASAGSSSNAACLLGLTALAFARRASVRARRAARALLLGGTRACRTRTAPALAAPRRRDRA